MYLADWFWELSRTRQHNGMTGMPEPVSYQEVLAWQQLTKVQLEPFELDLLLRMDRALIQIVGEGKEDGRGRSDSRRSR